MMDDSNRTEKSPQIILSLATYEPRYGKLEQTLHTVVGQTLKYDKLVINVQDDCSEETFAKIKALAAKINDDRILVVLRPKKWRSFNKYVHVYKEYPGAIIITMDDDIMYGEDFTQMLYDEWEKNKDCIICHETNPVFAINGKICPLQQMSVRLKQKEFGKYLSNCCLFPPNCFDGSEIAIDDYDAFYALTSGIHDELWMWVLSTRMGRYSITLDYSYSFGVDGFSMPPENTALSTLNGTKEATDRYVEKITECMEINF